MSVVMKSVDSVFGEAKSVVRREFPMAIAIALGFAISGFVKSIVNFLVMPLLDPAFRAVGSGYQWSETEVNVGPWSLPVGPLVAETISFFVFVLALYIFIQMFSKGVIFG